MRAVSELGYTPNLAASSLAAAQDTRIALIYTNPSAAYLRELLVGALRGASRTAAQLVIEAWDDLDAEAERAAVRALAQQRGRRDPAAAAVRIAGGGRRAGARRRAGGGDRFGPLHGVHLLRAHRRLPCQPARSPRT